MNNLMDAGRPVGVLIVALLSLLVGISLLVQGIQNLSENPNISYYFVQSGFLSVFLSWGLWKVKGWAWTMFIIVSVAGLVSTPFGLATLPVTEIIYTVALKCVTVVLILYITSKKVMVYFNKSSLRDEFL